ncbi:MAG: hypothetical protein R3B47_05110 [Bacteroidia bacterium]
MAFYLIMERFLKPGHKVIVGRPGYSTFNQIVKQKGGELVEIDVDDQGMVVDQVEVICQKTTIQFLYVIPHHHHPTTVTLSPERRLRLLELLPGAIIFALLRMIMTLTFIMKAVRYCRLRACSMADR